MYIGSVEPETNFDAIHYKDIMKGDSFNATILKKINSGQVDKAKLKKKCQTLVTI